MWLDCVATAAFYDGHNDDVDWIGIEIWIGVGISPPIDFHTSIQPNPGLVERGRGRCVQVEPNQVVLETSVRVYSCLIEAMCVLHFSYNNGRVLDVLY